MLRADERAFALDAFRNLLNAVKTVVGQDELDAIVNIARSDPAFEALTGRTEPASFVGLTGGFIGSIHEPGPDPSFRIGGLTGRADSYRSRWR